MNTRNVFTPGNMTRDMKQRNVLCVHAWSHTKNRKFFTHPINFVSYKCFFKNTIFVSNHMYPEKPVGTQVVLGSMNMGYIFVIKRHSNWRGTEQDYQLNLSLSSEFPFLSWLDHSTTSLQLSSCSHNKSFRPTSCATYQRLPTSTDPFPEYNSQLKIQNERMNISNSLFYLDVVENNMEGLDLACVDVLDCCVWMKRNLGKYVLTQVCHWRLFSGELAWNGVQVYSKTYLKNILITYRCRSTGHGRFCSMEEIVNRCRTKSWTL